MYIYVSQSNEYLLVYRCSYSRTKPIRNKGAVIDDGGELCIQVRWIDAPAAASTSKRKIVGEEQKLTLHGAVEGLRDQVQGDVRLDGLRREEPGQCQQGLVVTRRILERKTNFPGIQISNWDV